MVVALRSNLIYYGAPPLSVGYSRAPKCIVELTLSTPTFFFLFSVRYNYIAITSALKLYKCLARSRILDSGSGTITHYTNYQALAPVQPAFGEYTGDSRRTPTPQKQAHAYATCTCVFGCLSPVWHFPILDGYVDFQYFTSKFDTGGGANQTRENAGRRRHLFVYLDRTIVHRGGYRKF